MERDFLGLSNKQYLGNNVKLELGHGDTSELGLSKKGAKQWGKAKVFGTSNFISAANSQETTKAFPGAYKSSGSVSAASLFRRGHFFATFPNQKPMLLPGVPLTTHPSLLPLLDSSTDPRTVSSGSSPQLTIFYGGTVNVFHDISPEKAQAIMLCAANGLSSPLDSSKGHQTKDRVYGRQNLKVSSKTAVVPAAVSVSSSSATHSDSASMSIDKPITTSNAMNMIGSFCSAARNMIPSVPQARKASLARFLEKRKERLMNSTPYAMSKKKFLDLSTGESSGMNYTSTSAV